MIGSLFVTFIVRQQKLELDILRSTDFRTADAVQGHTLASIKSIEHVLIKLQAEVTLISFIEVSG